MCHMVHLALLENECQMLQAECHECQMLRVKCYGYITNMYTCYSFPFFIYFQNIVLPVKHFAKLILE